MAIELPSNYHLIAIPLPSNTQEAHVRWARYKCTPKGDDLLLRGDLATGSLGPGQSDGGGHGHEHGHGHGQRRPVAMQFGEQAHRWEEA